MKYTRPGDPAVIEVQQTITNDEFIFVVKDNGVGFDMKYSDKRFGVFQRLHLQDEFDGTGIGLATVERHRIFVLNPATLLRLVMRVQDASARVLDHSEQTIQSAIRRLKE